MTSADFLYEGDFEAPGTPRNIRVRISFPTKQGKSSFACKIHVAGDGTELERSASGADQLQCIANSVNFLRKYLSALGAQQAKTKTPSDLIFQRYLPVGYGWEFQKHLEALIEVEIAKKELLMREARKDA